jgi:HTH-type transcriptional regulator, glycine betaine synthesis regulator
VSPASDEPSGDDQSSDLWKSELLVTEAVGRLMSFWGFKRHLGRVWGLLYLSAEAQTSRDIQRRLALSAGSVSATLNELARWGVVRRVHVPGARAEHFEAEVNLWKMISRVFRERELVEVIEAVGAFEAALAALAQTPATTPEHQRRAQVQRARIEELLELAKLGRALLEALLATGRVDATALARLLLGQR